MSSSVPEQVLFQIQNTHTFHVENSWKDPFLLGYILALEANLSTPEANMTALMSTSFLGMLTCVYNQKDTERKFKNFVYLALKRKEHCKQLGKVQIHRCSIS